MMQASLYMCLSPDTLIIEITLKQSIIMSYVCGVCGECELR